VDRRDAHAAVVKALLRPRLLRALLASYEDRPWPAAADLRKFLLADGYPEQAVDRAAEVADQHVRETDLVVQISSGQEVLSLHHPAAAPSLISAGPGGVDIVGIVALLGLREESLLQCSGVRI
jgi:hypothetical protein